MARLKKCTEKDISMLLETDSDTNVEESTECYTPRKNIIKDSSDISDSDTVFDNNKSLLLRKNALQKEQVSLKLRLRRSTEQSNYKIDSDSDNERPRRSTRNLKHLKRLQDENKIPRKGTRIIKLPTKYSDYDCSSPSVEKHVLQKRQINYKTKESFISANNDKEEENKKHKIKYDNYKDNDSDTDCVCISFVSNKRSTRSNTKLRSNKQHCATSVENNDNDALPRIRTRSSKHISTDVTFKKDNINKTLLNKKITINSKTITTEDTSPHRTPEKRPFKMEYDSLDTTPKRKLAAIQHNALDHTPKRQIKNQESVRRSILSTPNKYKPTIYANEDKEKIDEVADICKNTKDMSITVEQRKKNIKNVNESTIIQNSPNTPKLRTSLKHNTLTPSVKMRVGVLVKPITQLQKARSRLHVSAIPKSLPCREEEFNDIYTFLESKLMDNRGGCIYVSGVPGTGKTATVNEVIKCLKHKLDQFDFVEVNGMKLSEPRQAYVQILKQLSGKTLTWEQAYNALEKRFNSNIKRPMTLLLVDELDLLCTKRQDVIYNLLDWPTKVSAQLVVITIANTMDLPERVLMGRVTSRLGLTRVSFQPYNHEQLQEIVITRLKGTNIFKNEAIQLIARKVSAMSGDARRALDICRRAAEITEIREGYTVSMEDVNQALSEMMANPKVRAIKHCSKMEQVFLQAVCAEVTRTGVEEVCFKNVYKQFESLCCFDDFQTPNVTEALDICDRLGSSRLLICEDASNDTYQRMLLNVSKDDIHYAL